MPFDLHTFIISPSVGGFGISTSSSTSGLLGSTILARFMVAIAALLVVVGCCYRSDGSLKLVLASYASLDSVSHECLHLLQVCRPGFLSALYISDRREMRLYI